MSYLLSERTRDMLTHARLLPAYQRAAAKARAYGWRPREAHRKALRVVERMRDGDCEATAIRVEIQRREETIKVSP